MNGLESSSDENLSLSLSVLVFRQNLIQIDFAGKLTVTEYRGEEEEEEEEDEEIGEEKKIGGFVWV